MTILRNSIFARGMESIFEEVRVLRSMEVLAEETGAYFTFVNMTNVKDFV